MALWLVRAGRHGEREDFALENNVVVIGWDGLKDLSAISSRDELVQVVAEAYPDEKPKARLNYASQIWAFVGRIQVGDWVVLPLKKRSAIAIGQVNGEYKYANIGGSGLAIRHCISGASAPASLKPISMGLPGKLLVGVFPGFGPGLIEARTPNDPR